VTEREVLRLDPGAGDPEVGRWLSAMDQARQDTVDELGEVTDAMLDERPPSAPNSIGTLLYHVALIEADWLFDDILGLDSDDDWPHDLIPYTDRDGEGTLTVVRGEDLATHLARLAAVRELVHQHLDGMPPDAFHEVRVRRRYDVSPAWVLHHLLQHEAEHRAHIAWVRDAILGRI
jgi:uncharacterized damage-inducible protein DinB